MDTLNRKTVYTQDGEKSISVHACDIRDLDVDVDVMTVSSFFRDYHPTPGTLFEALFEKNIDVDSMAGDPEIDLRDPCNIWLSRETDETALLPVKRIGCIELSPYSRDRSAWKERETGILSSIQAYFKMLDIASVMGIKIERIVLPVLGGGSQRISTEFIAIPLLNECISFLKNNRFVRRIMIVTRDHASAFTFAMTLEQSYSFHNEAALGKGMDKPYPGAGMAFISYSSKDKNIADNLCSKLESKGIKVWYAPRDILTSDYASAIVSAITKCSLFIVILSRNSIRSNHVLNEIDLAFKELQRGIRFHPLKIDEEEMGPAFMYYLSRQHWMDAHIPPLEARLQEFVEKIAEEGET